MFGLLEPPDESTLGKLFYRRGDYFEVASRSDHPVLVHCCNVRSGWGCGIAAQFATRYPHAKFVYDEYRQNEKLENLLGKCLWMPPPRVDPSNTTTPTHHIACLFVKERGGAPIGDEEKLKLLHYFRLSLEDFKRQLALQDKLDNVRVGQLFCPKLNAGIFNISWRLSAEIIKQSGLDMIVVFRDNDRGKAPDQLGPNELREEDTLLRSKMTGFNRLALRSAVDKCLIPWLPGPYPPPNTTISQLRKADKLAKERQLVMRRPAKRRRHSPPDEEEEESRRLRKDPPCVQQERPLAPKLLSPLKARDMTPRRGRQLARTPQDVNEYWRGVWKTKLQFTRETENVAGVGPINEEEMYQHTDILRDVHEGGGRLAVQFEKSEARFKLKLQSLPPAAALQEVKRMRMRNYLERRESLFRLMLQQKRFNIMQLEQMARLEDELSRTERTKQVSSKSSSQVDLTGISKEPAEAPAISVTTPKGLLSHIIVPPSKMPPPRQTPSGQESAETTSKKSSLKSESTKSPLKVTFKLDKKGMPLMERFGYRAEEPVVDLTGSDDDDDEWEDEDDNSSDELGEEESNSSGSESEDASLDADDETDSEANDEGQAEAEDEADGENKTGKDDSSASDKGQATGMNKSEQAKTPPSKGHNLTAASAAYAPSSAPSSALSSALSSVPSSALSGNSSITPPKKGMTLRPFLERTPLSQGTEAEAETETETERGSNASSAQIEVIELDETEE